MMDIVINSLTKKEVGYNVQNLEKLEMDHYRFFRKHIKLISYSIQNSCKYFPLLHFTHQPIFVMTLCVCVFFFLKYQQFCCSLRASTRNSFLFWVSSLREYWLGLFQLSIGLYPSSPHLFLISPVL